jgi:hypothetical protein
VEVEAGIRYFIVEALDAVYDDIIHLLATEVISRIATAVNGTGEFAGLTELLTRAKFANAHSCF